METCWSTITGELALDVDVHAQAERGSFGEHDFAEVSARFPRSPLAFEDTPQDGDTVVRGLLCVRQEAGGTVTAWMPLWGMLVIPLLLRNSGVRPAGACRCAGWDLLLRRFWRSCATGLPESGTTM